MNRIIDDYGRDVIAVGSPNSVERMKVTYPKLIQEIQAYYYDQPKYIFMDDMIQNYEYEKWKLESIWQAAMEGIS